MISCRDTGESEEVAPLLIIRPPRIIINIPSPLPIKKREASMRGPISETKYFVTGAQLPKNIADNVA